MMISGLVRAGQVLGEQNYLDAASNAVEFMRSTMRTLSDELARSRRAGQSSIESGLEDHAAFLIGMMDLAQAGGHDDLWTPIERLFLTCRSEFESTPGVYHDTRATRTDLFVRPRTMHDGATPSGIGMMTLATSRMVKISGEQRWVDWGIEVLNGASSSIATNPIGSTNATRSLIELIQQQARIGDAYTFAARSESNEENPDSPVSVFVSEREVTVSDDKPASFSVALEIESPYHIVSSDPGVSDESMADSLIPLRVGLISGQGIAVYGEPGHDARAIRRAFQLPIDGPNLAKAGKELSGPDRGIPLVGFHASGEIGPVGNTIFQHGHTLVAALFREPEDAGLWGTTSG